jgi:hypothetical protein
MIHDDQPGRRHMAGMANANAYDLEQLPRPATYCGRSLDSRIGIEPKGERQKAATEMSDKPQEFGNTATNGDG